MPRSRANRLLVEGAKDRRLFPYLMEQNGVNWPKDHEPVEIKDLGGRSLSKSDASAILKESGLLRLGIVLDADNDANSSWQLIKGWFEDSFVDMPDRIRDTGFISEPNSRGVRIGAWIMPDNQTPGMLETFLKFLVREDDKPLFNYAERACAEAKTQFAAPFKDVHKDKARMHAFLAWQDEPGRQLHEAVDHAVLDPTSPHSRPFVTWFRELYQV